MEKNEAEPDVEFFYDFKTNAKPDGKGAAFATVGVSQVELEQTGTSLNIRTSTDLKLLKAPSTYRGSVLKKGQTSKKDLRIKIQPEFLPKEEQETCLSFECLFEITQRVLPEAVKKLATMKVHQHSFAWAKRLEFTTGKTYKSIEEDKKKQSLMDFMEFLVYICILGHEIGKMQTVSGMDEKTMLEEVRQILSHLMPAYGFEVQEVPENDERGLHEHAQDILL